MSAKKIGSFLCGGMVAVALAGCGDNNDQREAGTSKPCPADLRAALTMAAQASIGK